MKDQKVNVYCRGELAGILIKKGQKYEFIYDEAYFNDPGKQPISLSFPKDRRMYQSDFLFPFFFGLLAEGENKQLQCLLLKIDERDHFTRLVKTAGSDTIGAVTVGEVGENS